MRNRIHDEQMAQLPLQAGNVLLGMLRRPNTEAELGFCYLGRPWCRELVRLQSALQQAWHGSICNQQFCLQDVLRPGSSLRTSTQGCPQPQRHPTEDWLEESLPNALLSDSKNLLKRRPVKGKESGTLLELDLSSLTSCPLAK